MYQRIIAESSAGCLEAGYGEEMVPVRAGHLAHVAVQVDALRPLDQERGLHAHCLEEPADTGSDMKIVLDGGSV